MKKRFFILSVFICGFLSLQAQQKSKEEFYYYQGEKIFLTERTDKIFLKLTKGANKASMLALIRSDSIVKLSTDVKQSELLPDFLTLEVRESKIGTKIPVSKVEQYKINVNVISASPILQY
jgi:hypothetical protein